MITKEQVLYRFDNYYFERFIFTVNPQIKEDSFEIEGNVDIKVGYPDGNTSCILKLDFNIFPDITKGPFNIQGTMIGKFSFKEPLPKEQIDRFIKFNGIGTITPYLRTAITDITKVANTNPLILPFLNPLDFELEVLDLDKESILYESNIPG